MSRTFNGTTDELQSGVSTSNKPSDWPMSISLWARNTRTVSTGVPADTMFTCADDGAANDPRVVFRLIEDAGDVLFQVFFKDAVPAQQDCIVTITGYTAGEWNHYGFVGTSDTSKECFFNGTTQTNTEASNVGFAPLDRVDIGFIGNFGGLEHWEGDIADVGLWDVALTDAHMDALGAGYSPANFPNGLLSHWPLFGRNSPENDRFGDTSLTVTGATAGVHPPIILPHKRRFFSVPAAAAAAAKSPQLMMMGVGN